MRIVLVLALAPLALFVATPAAAQAPVIAVEVGFDDAGSTGGWTPITVTTRPDRPFLGELQIHAQDQNSGVRTTTVVPLDIAAGAPVAVRRVAPPGRLSVSLHEGEEQVASAQANRRARSAEMLVGVLGVEAPTGPPVTMLQGNMTTRWVGVDPEWLALPHGLESLDVLVVGPDEWASMDEDARSVVHGEVALGGMSLVLTDDPDEPVLGVDISLADPGPEGIAVRDGEGDPARTVAVVHPKGLGRVAVTAGDPTTLSSTVAWEAVVTPRPGVPDVRDADSYYAQPWASHDLLQFSGDVPVVPAIPFLAVFLLGYLLVVGPLNAVVLGRLGRRELAWITVPAISVVFALGPVVVSNAPATGAPVTSHTMTWWLDGAGEERVAAAWLGIRTGTQSATFEGEEWAAVPWGGQLGDARVITDGPRTHARAEVRNGEVMGALATRPVAAPPPMEVDATLVDGQIQVTVTNTSDAPVDDAQLLVGNTVRPLDRLEPGDIATVTHDGALQGQMPHLPGFPAGDQFAAFAGGMPTAQPPPPFPDEFGVADQVWFPGQGVQLFPAPVRLGTPGLVWVVAGVDADPSGWTVDGASGGTADAMVAVGSRVRTEAPVAVMPPAAVMTQGIETGQFFDHGSIWVPELIGNGLMRVRLPELADGAQLGGFLQSFGPVELWDDTARTWRNVNRSFEGVAAGPILTPGHEVFIRMQGEAMGSGLAVAPPGQPPGPETVNGMFIGQLEPAVEFMTPMPIPTPVPIPTPAEGQ